MSNENDILEADITALERTLRRENALLRADLDEAVRALADLANKVDEDGLVSAWAIADARAFLTRMAGGRGDG